MQSLLFSILCQSSLFFVVTLRPDETAAGSKIHGCKHTLGHTGTQSHTHTPVAAPPGGVSSLARCVVKPASRVSACLVGPHICLLAWQPSGHMPHVV